ncbi:MAG TPA: ABC transporter permease [Acidimicrobiales bacterium]|nr:ABC transporter permease [Acidimicrobiales bacterium]
MQWRRRRFVIAVLGTALVMANTLLLTGFQATFDNEIHHTLKLIDADGYVMPKGRPGPFLGGTPIPLDIAQQAGQLEGVKAASPMIITPQVDDQKHHADIFLIAAQPGALGTPAPATGRAPSVDGEAVIDTKSGLRVGDTFAISGRALRVVGTVSHETFNGGRPTVYTTLHEAQQIMFAGQPFVTAIAVKGVPQQVPAAAQFMTSQQAGHDLKRPLGDVIKSISTFRSILWVVAIAIVGSVVYLSALERVGDFAVFKATGTATVDLLGALVIQAVVLAVTASVVACALAYGLRGMFPVQPLLPARLQLTLPVVGAVIGLLASGAALRRAVTVDPALAFGGH